NDVNREVGPRELWDRGHLGGCFISDDAGIAARHVIGVDKIMFESDYPHSDSNWPHTRKVLAESLVDVPDAEAEAMCEGNARKFYDFPRMSWGQRRWPRRCRGHCSCGSCAGDGDLWTNISEGRRVAKRLII